MDFHSIDGEGGVQAMKRKPPLHRSKQRGQVAEARGNERRWYRLAQLANEAPGISEVAKWWLNTVFLERGGSFIGLDSEKAAKLARTLERRRCLWKDSSDNGLGLMIYNQIAVSVRRRTGRLQTTSATPRPAVTAAAPLPAQTRAAPPARAPTDVPTDGPDNLKAPV